jgi:hypothetical protein
MRQRRVRTPNRATAINKPIQRPDTYQRLPEDVQLNPSSRPILILHLGSGTKPLARQWCLLRSFYLPI